MQTIIPAYLIVLSLFALPAFADGTGYYEEPPERAQGSDHHNTEINNASQAASEAISKAFSGSDVSVRHIGIGGSSAPQAIQPNDCWKPKEGILKRGHRWLFGLFEVTALAELDSACVNYRLEVLRLEAELERERRMRIQAETSFYVEASK